jgi:hypothetical protein
MGGVLDKSFEEIAKTEQTGRTDSSKENEANTPKTDPTQAPASEPDKKEQ